MNKAKIKKYVITACVGVALTLGLLYSFGLFGGELTANEVMRVLADSFSVTGLIMIGIFCLVFVSAQGLFDSLAYIGKVAVRSLMPGMRHNKYEKYGDYKLKKEEKRLNVKEYLFILFIGLVFTFIGCVFTILFYFV